MLSFGTAVLCKPGRTAGMNCCSGPGGAVGGNMAAAGLATMGGCGGNVGAGGGNIAAGGGLGGGGTAWYNEPI